MAATPATTPPMGAMPTMMRRITASVSREELSQGGQPLALQDANSMAVAIPQGEAGGGGGFDRFKKKSITLEKTDMAKTTSMVNEKVADLKSQLKSGSSGTSFIIEKPAVQQLLRPEPKPMAHRLKKKWVKDEVLKSIDERIFNYSMRHGGLKKLMKEAQGAPGAAAEARGPLSKQMAILEKMKKEADEGARQLPVEEATNKALRSGQREYVDYALDEVDRYDSAAKTGQVVADFDWTCAGDFKDIPSLRRSKFTNRVDGPKGRFLSGTQGALVYYPMDFMRDFCKQPEYGEHIWRQPEILNGMRTTSIEMRPETLYRADDGSPLIRKVDMSLTSSSGGWPSRSLASVKSMPDMPGRRTFGPREWSVAYSTI